MGGVDARPGFDDGENLDGFEVGKSEVVGFGEGQDVAFASNPFCFEKKIREAWDCMSKVLE